ncbi:uncharacterized [Tachysurus ichikawai]
MGELGQKPDSPKSRQKKKLLALWHSQLFQALSQGLDLLFDTGCSKQSKPAICQVIELAEDVEYLKKKMQREKATQQERDECTNMEQRQTC